MSETDHSLNANAAAMTDHSAQLARLRPYNLVAGSLHLAQAIAILVLANSFSLPIQATYMTGPPGPTVGRQSVTLFNLSFAWAIAAFFALSALAHFSVSGPGWHSYQTQLRKNRNPYRWLEYSLSASIMIVLIAMLVGINDIAALVALVGVNASMIGFGWMQDATKHPQRDLAPSGSAALPASSRGSPSRSTWSDPAPTGTHQASSTESSSPSSSSSTASRSTSGCNTNSWAAGRTTSSANAPTSPCRSSPKVCSRGKYSPPPSHQVHSV